MIGQILFFAINPDASDSFDQQVKDCFKKIQNLNDEYYKDGYLIAKATFFIDSQNANDFQSKRDYIMSVNSKKQLPVISVVSQSPFERDVAVEVFLINAVNYSYKHYNGYAYLLIENANEKVLISQGLYTPENKNESIFSQSTFVFENMKHMLHSEGFDFCDIVRQWNYIENITIIEGQHQNYQVFNDVRSHYYNECNHINGYPAATGIGTQNGGVTVDFIAIKSDTVKIISIKSPIQTDAHNYSENVLAINKEGNIPHKTTPKFERAKYVGNDVSSTILISGTAAIRGETTEYFGDFIKQTELTLSNIEALYSIKNLERYNINENNFRPEFFRFYVKNKSHQALLKAYIEEQLPIECHYLIVQSDICRDNLLVEVEGIVIATKK